jgi:hypothetical protein
MAATRRNAMLIAEAREKIRTTQLINRLQDHALGEIDMSQTQVRAVEILLRKSVPDLATVTLQGDDEGGPVVMSIEERRAEALRAIDEAFREPEPK